MIMETTISLDILADPDCSNHLDGHPGESSFDFLFTWGTKQKKNFEGV